MVTEEYINVYMRTEIDIYMCIYMSQVSICGQWVYIYIYLCIYRNPVYVSDQHHKTVLLYAARLVLTLIKAGLDLKASTCFITEVPDGRGAMCLRQSLL